MNHDSAVSVPNVLALAIVLKIDSREADHAGLNVNSRCVYLSCDELDSDLPHGRVRRLDAGIVVKYQVFRVFSLCNEHSPAVPCHHSGPVEVYFSLCTEAKEHKKILTGTRKLGRATNTGVIARDVRIPHVHHFPRK